MTYRNTDPVLAGDVQIEHDEDEREAEAKFALTSEAGLNDALAFPFIHLAIAIAAAGALTQSVATDWLIKDVLWKLSAGLAMGAGMNMGAQHSQSMYSLLTAVPGLKVVVPSNAYDAKGLLISAIEDNDPVIFFEPKRIYNGPFSGYYDKPVEPWKKHPDSVVPEGYYKVPLGKARTVREGEALTVLAYGTMVHVAEAVCAAKGVDAEILDLRTLVPLDIETIKASVEKTGKCLIVHEATRTGGFGAELSALVQERCFYHLEAPVERVTGFDTPYPHSLEWAYFPGPVRIGEAIDRLMKA